MTNCVFCEKKNVYKYNIDIKKVYKRIDARNACNRLM